MRVATIRVQEIHVETIGVTAQTNSFTTSLPNPQIVAEPTIRAQVSSQGDLSAERIFSVHLSLVRGVQDLSGLKPSILLNS
jgi:hypothetical protein